MNRGVGGISYVSKLLIKIQYYVNKLISNKMSEKHPKYYLYSNSEKISIENDNVFFNDKSLLEKEDSKDPETLIKKAQEYSRKQYADILKSSAFKNTIILTGAGASIEGAKKGDYKLKQWNNIKDKIGNSKFTALCKEVNFDETKQDIEKLLTKAHSYLEKNEITTIKYEDDKEIQLLNLIKEIKTSISDIKDDSSGDDRSGLWNAAKNKIGDSKFTALCKDLNFDEAKQDIEELLTKAYLHLKLNQAITIKSEDDNEIQLQDLIKEIETSIVDECSLELDGDIHAKFINKLTNRNLKLPRVKFFTTNYDTLIEQAAQNCGITLIDGFSFTMPRTFSGRNFDYDIVYREKSRIKNEESFVPKVLHLYKMHGSLDWERNGDKITISNSNKGQKIIIYPASNKYESSYEQPYFEMMSRFQNYLRQENTLLIIIGFSLYDKHISNVILEAVNQNPNFTLLIFNYYEDKESKEPAIPIDDKYLKQFINKENVYIINEKFSDLANYFPSNQVYSNTNTFENENESIQS